MRFGNYPLDAGTETDQVEPSLEANLKHLLICTLMAAFLAASACTPTVKVEAPDKPITINLNVKIEHEIRVKVDKELEDLFDEDSGLF